MKDKSIRHDHRGRAPLGTLAKPRTISLDADRLKKLATDIVNGTTKTLSDDDRTAFEATIFRLDGAALKPGHDRHPVFIATVLLGVYRQHQIDSARAGNVPTTTTITAPKMTAKERERLAKDQMRRDSANAWQKKTK